MNIADIKKTIIKEILNIAPEIEEAEIVDDENIQHSLEIDSFDFLKILIALNEKLGVEVPEADYTKVDTLNKMVDYFSKRL
ncbi:acyl carrier protein [bacterium]|nr:acyl carrier protein [bacterium]MBU1959526.1 acyl carrier protein [bacterium]